MKVLIATNSIGLYQGGHSKNIFRLAIELEKKNIDVSIFTFYIHDIDVNNYNVKIYKSSLKRYSLKSFSKELSDFIVKNNFDLIHSNGAVNYFYNKNIGKIPTIFHARSHNLSNFKASLYDKYSYTSFRLIRNLLGLYYEYYFDKKYLKLGSNIIANCQDVKNRIVSDVGNINNIKVIHNAISNIDIDFKADSENGRVFGYLANFYPIKGWDYLIRIIKFALKTETNIYFILAGDGPLFGKVRMKLKNEIRAGNVKLLGRLSSEEQKNMFFKSINYFVCPAHAPTTVTEALKYGIPVFHFKRWFDCADGMDLADFKKADIYLEAQDLSAHSAAKILLNANNYFGSKNPIEIKSVLENKYSWNKVAKETIAFYSSILYG